MAVRVIGARRAFNLLFRETAEVISIEEGNYRNYDFDRWCDLSRLKREFEPDNYDWVAAVNFYVAVPRIVRLLSYDKIPWGNVRLNRRNIFARDRNKCQYCGRRFATSELSLDHVVPRRLGGGESWENLVCSCVKCNSRKGDKTPVQAGMKLINKPVKPRRNPQIHVHLGHERYASWKQFLDHAYWSVELK